MASTFFREGVTFLDKFGLYDVILPFLLVFAIVYGILEKVKFLGKESKNYNIIIAISFAFFTIAMYNVVTSINILLSNLSVIFIIVLGFALLIGFTGFQFSKDSYITKGFKIFLLVVFAILLLESFKLTDSFKSALSLLFNPAALIIIFVIISFFAVTYSSKKTLEVSGTPIKGESEPNKKELKKEKTNSKPAKEISKGGSKPESKAEEISEEKQSPETKGQSLNKDEESRLEKLAEILRDELKKEGRRR